MSDALTAKLRALSDPRACQDNEFGASVACAEALAEIQALRGEVELHETHWTEARDERNKIRAWLCDKGLDAEYGESCDVPGCPKAWEAENEALRARMEKLEAALGWAIGWVAEEIEPCRRRNEGCPWDEDHDRLDDARALLAAVERTP